MKEKTGDFFLFFISFNLTISQSIDHYIYIFNNNKIMKIILLAFIAIISLNIAHAIDRDSSLLTSQTADRKRISSSKANALQALGVGLDSTKVSVGSATENGRSFAILASSQPSRLPLCTSQR